MNKKGKFLSMLALGLTLPAVMLTGCAGSDPSHEKTTAFAHNETHHWYKCACGESDCEFEYEKELHDFEEISTETVQGVTTKIYGCDCGETKSEEVLNQEWAFELLKSVIASYKGGMKTYTINGLQNLVVKDMENLQGVARQQCNGTVYQEGFIKIVNDNETFKMYKKLVDVPSGMGNDDYVYSVETITRSKAISILSGQDEIYGHYFDYTDGGIINQTYDGLKEFFESMGVEMNFEKVENGYKLTQTYLNETAYMIYNQTSIITEYNSDTGFTNYSDNFNENLFNSFDINEAGFNN